MLNKWSEWIPFWEEGGEPIEKTLENILGKDERALPEIRDFFEKHGDLLLEFIEKASFVRMSSKEFENMTDVQKGLIGHEVFQRFLQQLLAEYYTRQAAQKVQEEEE